MSSEYPDGSSQRSADRDSYAPAGASARESRGTLLNIISTRIIPRLVGDSCLSFPEAGRAQPVVADTHQLKVTPPALPCSEEALRLVELLLQAEEGPAIQFAKALPDDGFDIDAIYNDVLAPAASQLGELWEDDRCSFVDVTIALSRMHHIVHDLSHSYDMPKASQANAPVILLVPTPGSQHTLGILILGDVFRRAGWEVVGDPTVTTNALMSAVSSERLDLVGLSVGSEAQIKGLPALISQIRQRSKNRHIKVMVGGPLFLANPSLVEAVGADGTGADGESTIKAARQLLAR
ncbi:MAG: B12-binding domain-containing protein [Burkholderiaceae bacterium]